MPSRYLIAVAWLLLAASVVGTVWVLFFNGAEVIRHHILTVTTYAATQWQLNPLPLLTVYFCVCLITQLIVIPSGSVILMVSGFILGPFVAAAVFSIAQIVATFPVFRAAQLLITRDKKGRFNSFLEKYAVGKMAGAIQQEAVAAGAVLRLTPVIPSAAACCLAALLRLSLQSFFIATLLVCWIRPFFFASVGGAFKELGSLRRVIDGTASLDIWPLSVVFVAAVLLLLSRLWVRGQQ